MFSDLYITGVKLNCDVPKENYLADLPVIKNLASVRELPISKRVTFIIGENGTGKSTLLEAIAVACGFNAEGGTKNFCFSTAETHSRLAEYITVCRGTKREKDGFFLRAESFYNVASNIDEMDAVPAAAPKVIGSYGGRSLHRQSHGESFMALEENRFGGNGLYLLDEPEAALSPARQMTLLAHIKQLEDQNSQFIIATHSPMLLTYPGAEIYVLTEDGIISSPYDETEHYKLAKAFLDNPAKMYRYLFE